MPIKRVNGKKLRHSPTVEISLPPTYFRRLVERSQSRGVSKSEAIRQFMDDADHASVSPSPPPALAPSLLPGEKTVLRDIAGQIRVAAVKLTGRLRLIDQPADLAAEIEKLAERLLVSL